ncbi:AbrB/MazE/SpoVT family DNA-binding domain-containing protein [Desulfonema magnum]|uniref:Transcriptional regulator, AbrB family n=1 Tax=Desulfonema magnum TaxID=45655 RepID=A0A975BLH7_9BACT|nr:AbrB/MazE/SpoVT family DNA-binding domain-containing protein [Desulfonema magnum]QTA87303.1 Transcriptional regulator, AbrB family [Desulfonema magnum]
MQITAEGQVTIPRHIREQLGIRPDSEVEFMEENGRFYLIRKESNKFRRFRGVATVKMSTDEIMDMTRSDK